MGIVLLTMLKNAGRKELETFRKCFRSVVPSPAVTSHCAVGASDIRHRCPAKQKVGRSLSTDPLTP